MIENSQLDLLWHSLVFRYIILSYFLLHCNDTIICSIPSWQLNICYMFEVKKVREGRNTTTNIVKLLNLAQYAQLTSIYFITLRCSIYLDVTDIEFYIEPVHKTVCVILIFIKLHEHPLCYYIRNVRSNDVLIDFGFSNRKSYVLYTHHTIFI